MTERVRAFLTSISPRDTRITMIRNALRWSGLVVLITLANPALGSMPESFASLNTSREVSLSTSLRIAAREGRLKNVQSLIAEGANVNATGEFGETALMGAARFNHTQVSEFLLSKGADVNLRDSKERTALMLASMNCSHRISSKMIPANANVNLTSLEGRTALIYAAIGGCHQIVQQLLQATGIDVNVVDESGRTALDYAMSAAQLEVGGPYTDIARMLRAAGGITAEFDLVPQRKALPQLAPSKPLH